MTTTTLIQSQTSEKVEVRGATKIAPDIYQASLSENYEYGDASLFGEPISINDVEGVPMKILELYASLALRHADVREIEEGQWVATVAGLSGAYGEGKTARKAETDLKETIVSWVVVKRRVGATDIPPMEGLDLNPRDSSSNDEIPASATQRRPDGSPWE